MPVSQTEDPSKKLWKVDNSNFHMIPITNDSKYQFCTTWRIFPDHITYVCVKFAKYYQKMNLVTYFLANSKDSWTKGTQNFHLIVFLLFCFFVCLFLFFLIFLEKSPYVDVCKLLLHVHTFANISHLAEIVNCPCNLNRSRFIRSSMNLSRVIQF